MVSTDRHFSFRINTVLWHDAEVIEKWICDLETSFRKKCVHFIEFSVVWIWSCFVSKISLVSINCCILLNVYLFLFLLLSFFSTVCFITCLFLYKDICIRCSRRGLGWQESPLCECPCWCYYVDCFVSLVCLIWYYYFEFTCCFLFLFCFYACLTFVTWWFVSWCRGFMSEDPLKNKMVYIM